MFTLELYCMRTGSGSNSNAAAFGSPQLITTPVGTRARSRELLITPKQQQRSLLSSNSAHHKKARLATGLAACLPSLGGAVAQLGEISAAGTPTTARNTMPGQSMLPQCAIMYLTLLLTKQ